MFKCFVVRYSNLLLENFTQFERLPSDLVKQEVWDRNQIKEVHFITDRIAGIAHDAAELSTFKKLPGFGHHDGEVYTRPILRRVGQL